MSADEIQELKAQVREIHAAIVGNEAMGHRGIAARLTAVEDQGRDHSRKFYTLAGVFTGVNLIIAWAKMRILGVE